MQCVGNVSLLLILLYFALTDLAIYDDRPTRGQPRHHCKTVRSNSIGLSSSNTSFGYCRACRHYETLLSNVHLWKTVSMCPKQ